MISAVTADQPIAASAAIEYRHRPFPGERSLLPDSTPPAPPAPDARNEKAFGQSEARQPPAQPERPAKSSSSMFAAAVLAGALAPTPQTLDELVRRIGSSPIPEESQARLKDLLV